MTNDQMEGNTMNPEQQQTDWEDKQYRLMADYKKHEEENPDVIEEADGALDAEYASHLARANNDQ